MVSIEQRILEKAIEIITSDRRIEYGDAKESFDSIAALWTWYVRTKYKVDITITGEDVALMMPLMKISRHVTGESKEDNLVDGSGYLALAGRWLKIATKEKAAIKGDNK